MTSMPGIPTIEKQVVVKRATQSVKWSALGELAPRMVTPITTMILAGTLTPNEFGTAAVAILVINLAQILTEFGFKQGVIQRRTHIEEAASIAFWFNVAVSSLLYFILWFIAPLIARSYDNPELVTVLRVSGLALAAYGLGAVPTGLLMRELEFHKLFWVTSLPPTLTGIMSVFWAINGAGVWAIILGVLTGQTIKTLAVWGLVSWRPSWSFDFMIFGELIRFSVWVALSGIQTWLFLQADNAIAGLCFGTAEMGKYVLAFNISSLLPIMLMTSLSVVAYPVFCSFQLDKSDIDDSLLKLQSLAATVLFPIAFGLSAIGGTVFSLLYGDRWEGIGPIIGLLAIMPGLSQLWALNGDVYRAISRPDIWTKIAMLTLAFLIPLLLLAGTGGLLIYTGARFLGGLLLAVINILAARYILKISFKRQFDAFRTPLIAAVIMFVVVLVLVEILSPFEGIAGWTKLFLVVSLGATTYGALVAWVDWTLMISVLRAVRRVGIGR